MILINYIIYFYFTSKTHYTIMYKIKNDYILSGEGSYCFTNIKINFII